MTTPELADVVAHKKSSKSGEDVYRVVLDVLTGDEPVSLEPWKAVLATPELRQEWDPAVEDAHLVEVLDHRTRICKTNFTLGWPAKYVLAFYIRSSSLTVAKVLGTSSLSLVHSTTLPPS